ncbi:hypothetical protein DSECCO2_196580 [anaerobic digester metagenome]
MKHIFIINQECKAIMSGNEIRSFLMNKDNFEYLVFNRNYVGHEAELVSKMCRLFQEENIRFYSCGDATTLFHVLRGIDSFQNREIAFFHNGGKADFLENFEEKQLFMDLDSLIGGQVTYLDYVQLQDVICCNSLSVGADVRMQLIADKIKKTMSISDNFAYRLALLLDTLVGFKSEELHITIDGKNYNGNYLLAHIANGKCYNSIFYPTKEHTPVDGELDILLWKESTTMRWLEGYNAYRMGNLATLSDVLIHIKGKQFKISSSDGRKLLFQCDGVEQYCEEMSGNLQQGGIPFVLPKGVGVIGKEGVDG